jgi:hypothetical protein
VNTIPEPSGNQDDVPPMEVFRSAEAFLDAADRERQWVNDQPAKWTLAQAMPIYFLYGQAIELALKAFLRTRGFSGRKLANKPYGHNLFALYRTCREHLLFTDAHCLAMIGIVAAHYSDADWHIKFRYVSDLRREFPTFEAVSVFSRALFEAVRPTCDGMDPLEVAFLFMPPSELPEETSVMF